MDLYSTYARLRQPFEINPHTELDIADRALIGDGFSAATVAVDGSIDWLCWPRFDSPSVFAKLLDPEGGHFQIAPLAQNYQSFQRYDPDTNVLETLFVVPNEGIVRLSDFMPCTDDPRADGGEIHRRIEGMEGEVQLKLHFNPKPGYGKTPRKFKTSPHGVTCCIANESSENKYLSLACEGIDLQCDNTLGARGQFSLEQGELKWVVAVLREKTPKACAHYRSFEKLRATRKFWRAFSATLKYDGPWRHHVLRSALTLKLLQYRPSGALVAAPTTSLPEWPGGIRNWDYRYAWCRDAGLCVRASTLIGFDSLAREFFHFIRDVLEVSPHLELMYTIDGQAVPEEQELSHWQGFANSRPVRIGNGARDQLQLDNPGYIFDGAWVYEQHGGQIARRTWQQLTQVLAHHEKNWQQADHGIWEPRGEQRHNLHSRLLSWVAFDRGAKLAEKFAEPAQAKHYTKVADSIRADIFAHGIHPDGHFVSYYGGKSADATLLLMLPYGFAKEETELHQKTLDFVRKELESDGFIYRYHDNDGLSGGEGAFILCGFWLAETLALLGHTQEAMKVFSHHARHTNHVGLLAEEIDPSSKIQLGNFPQGFSHMGLIHAASSIDRALRRSPEL